MSLNIALDELRATGWSALDTAGCVYDADGRMYPRVDRVEREFAAAGADFEIKQHDKFSCARATWTSDWGQSGSAVGQTPEEAAIYALAQFRRAAASPVM